MKNKLITFYETISIVNGISGILLMTFFLIDAFFGESVTNVDLLILGLSFLCLAVFIYTIKKAEKLQYEQDKRDMGRWTDKSVK